MESKSDWPEPIKTNKKQCPKCGGYALERAGRSLGGNSAFPDKLIGKIYRCSVDGTLIEIPYGNEK